MIDGIVNEASLKKELLQIFTTDAAYVSPYLKAAATMRVRD